MANYKILGALKLLRNRNSVKYIPKGMYLFSDYD